ncbi:thiamine/thiamine pyrophosphate ABC transporter permease ThiP [Gemmobacter lanyuensis]|uniref:Thiamine/thiamine pyrophosphate ABC transporter permease ThiP n=1 Tax=Gemmobacter lanyuensis TaxID=1054497 RepID=A0A918IRW7_9RHOB|nr:thiamine/thiamine pyrophosphate ABC transporter permease ThiP [Gemmobacter lanyuensis]GGW29143.1 thiamine/thiamine pyrophosphate ABC transporter permease ThiP [Gemmobacter lanyuensis]
MARRAGALIAAGLAFLTLGPVGIVMMQAGEGALSSADYAALRFTVLQAALSALLSVACAAPLARALARRRFPGRGVLIAALGAPFLLPVLVAVLGLLAIFGRAGVVNGALRGLALPEVSIFGLGGVLLAHVFLNMPLATRMILQGWQAIPAERLRLAQSLGFRPADHWRHIERPMLRDVVPGALLAVFAICLSSFAVVLVLGGGPSATTIELAIYQAVRFEFDLPRAAMLALLQVTVCGGAVAVAAWMTAPGGFGAGLDRALELHPPRGWRRLADAGVILLAAAFLAGPLVAVLLRGLPGLMALPHAVWPALMTSLLVAVLAAPLAVGSALALALGRAQGTRWLEPAAMLPMAGSQLVLGTGLFLMIFPFASPAAVAVPVTVLVTAIMALPFAYRMLAPEARALVADYGRLAGSLNLRGMAALRLLVIPRLRRPLGFSLGLTAALAVGDLGVIALFATEDGATLPLVISRLMGSYRMTQAAGAALLLVICAFGLFWICDRWGRGGTED